MLIFSVLKKVGNCKIKEIVVDEMTWWDRIAMAVELLESRFPPHCQVVVCRGLVVRWIGYEATISNLSLAPGQAPSATAYVFNQIENSEILRRLNQMPDEIHMRELRQPFAIYCPEQATFVAINAPYISLETHLGKLSRF